MHMWSRVILGRVERHADSGCWVEGPAETRRLRVKKMEVGSAGADDVVVVPHGLT
jgi:hypothetical protein